MTGGRVALAVALSLVFPGLGQGLAEKRVRMAGFAIADLVATVGVMFSVWSLIASVVVRLVAAVDTFVCMRRHHGRESWGTAAFAVALGGVGIAFANFAVEGFRIPSESMVPTLAVDDQVYVDKLSLRWHPPERGEVVVFTQPCAKVAYVKRVIGMGGDTVEVRCGVVYVNGKGVPQTQVTASRYREVLDGRAYDVLESADHHDFPQRDVMIPPSCVQGNFYDRPVHDQPQGKLVETKPKGAVGACEPQLHFVVPPKSLFVMGDNRNNANDSRYWGVVPLRAVIGRVIGLYAPWSRFGGIR